MLVTKELNLSTIKYYGTTDLSTNWFINEFLKNQNFILQSVSNYQDYNALLEQDFIFGFYLLNLLFLHDDILKNEFTNLDSTIKDNYSNQIKIILNTLNLKNTRHAVNLFQNWALDNLNQHFQNNSYIQIKSTLITYNEILEVFLKYPNLNTEEKVKKMVLLIDKDKRCYSNFLNLKFKDKKIMEKHFQDFIEAAIKNESNLSDNLELVDTYLTSIKKDADFSQKAENIIAFCKKQLDPLKNPYFIFSNAEKFLNLIKIHNLNLPSTIDLRVWFENVQKEWFKLPGWTKIETPLPNLNDEIHQKVINEFKDNVKDSTLKTLFYNPKHKSSFWDEKPTKKNLANFSELFDNHARGSYSNNSIKHLLMSEVIKTKIFFQFFSDKEVFKIYLDNLADILECVLYDLEIIEEERIFVLERYYEIINQLIEEKHQVDDKNSFWYMKKITLLLSAIDNLIKIFMKKNHDKDFTLINDLNKLALSTCLGKRDTNNLEKGTNFTPSIYISNILSDKAKIALDYYLYAPILVGGNEFRNSIIHGDYFSKKFFNYETFFTINVLFFQLIEELTMNYILEKRQSINLKVFLKETRNFNYQGKSIKPSEFVNLYQEYLNQEFQNFIEKHKLLISDYAITFKVNYLEETNETELEVEVFKSWVEKYKGNISFNNN